MALVLADRVLETCTSPGTGAVTLLGATTGYQTFSSGVGDGNTCYYAIADQSGANWEVGIGTYATSGNTLTRTTPLSGSASTPVNFSSGTQNVFVTYPAEKSVNLDASGNVSALGTITSGTWNGTTIAIANGGTGQTSASAAFNALSPITATGDLIVGNGTNSATRLAVGTNGYVLTSDGTTAVWAAPVPTGSTYTRTSFTATAGQTTFSVSYTVGYVEVYLNGVFLNGTDYTATNGTTVVLNSAASLNDIVETIAYNTTSIGTASTAANIANGAASQILYQASSGSTAFIANGTSGQVLTSNGSSAPSWEDGLSLSDNNTWTGIQTFGVAARETKVAIAASDIDLATANYFSKTISGTTTFTVSNVPTTGTVSSFILDLTNGGSATVNWWSGVKWAGGTAPTLTASGRDVLGFFTYDGGTIWTGLVLGLDVK